MDNIRELLDAVNKVFSIKLSVGTMFYAGLGYFIWKHQGTVLMAGTIGAIKGVWAFIFG